MQPPGEGWWSLKVLWEARVTTIKNKKLLSISAARLLLMVIKASGTPLGLSPAPSHKPRVTSMSTEAQEGPTVKQPI